MLYKTLDFGVDGKIVMTINDAGQQAAHYGDRVMVEAVVKSENLIDFGCRVEIPTQSPAISWGQFFKYSGYRRNFTAETYQEAVDLASEWLDEVAKVASNAFMQRRAAYFSAGNPPAKD